VDGGREVNPEPACTCIIPHGPAEDLGRVPTPADGDEVEPARGGVVRAPVEGEVGRVHRLEVGLGADRAARIHAESGDLAEVADGERGIGGGREQTRVRQDRAQHRNEGTRNAAQQGVTSLASRGNHIAWTVTNDLGQRDGRVAA
jgi:hypothetical protein